jgi:hypothetical protein
MRAEETLQGARASVLCRGAMGVGWGACEIWGLWDWEEMEWDLGGC